ncbi:hypothetical protein P261_01813 [Lachnospiraceae bacterium TWA4]|nr:hypothetical protein P261_01813 [Lachnospiraceae bacterium TWA4]
MSVNYYILFDNYTQAMALQDIFRKAELPSRITPTPHSIQDRVGCGVALLIQEEDIDAVKSCIEKNHGIYAEIVEMPCQINPKRNKFC